MYRYEIVDEDKYRVVGNNYNSVFLGTEIEAIAKVSELNLALVEYLKLEKINEVQQSFSDFKKAKEAKYMKEEGETFDIQKADALAYEKATDKTDTSITPIITRMANGNEPFRIALIEAVLANMTEIAIAQGEMVMKRDMIKACETMADFEALGF